VELQHVAIGVSAGGAAAARAFYGGLLGLEERPVPEGVDPEGFIWYRVGGPNRELHLHILDEPDPPPVRAHFCLLVGDALDELRARIDAAGIETRDPQRWRSRGAFFCLDPFGNLLEFARHAHS
jgi:catechol 2,3-dioxygenase-like lactoylglutathione lyase family enzyme